MNEVQAAFGLTLLDQLEEAQARRADCSELYDSLLEGRLQRPLWNPHASKNHAYYPVLFSNEVMLKRVQAALNAAEIFPRRYFYPSLDELDFLTTGAQVMPASRDAAHRVLCLPLYDTLEEGEVEKISRIVLKGIEAQP
jgi:dTDP-4-amino-4,6-dideoxygalactose transaminase